MTILKSINDRIGRGASPPPPPVQWATMSMPGWNATSFDCDADASTLQVQRRRQHECDDLPLSDMTEMAVGDVHIVATSCKLSYVIITTDCCIDIGRYFASTKLQILKVIVLNTLNVQRRHDCWAYCIDRHLLSPKGTDGKYVK